jgi:Flp pilus assembly protein TadD
MEGNRTASAVNCACQTLPNPVCIGYFASMKYLSAFVVLALALSFLPEVHGQENPDDQYLVIYGLIQQADSFDSSGEPRRALEDYTEAQNRLQKFQTVFPDWNPKIVSFRMDYLADKIAEDQAKLPVTSTPTHTAPKVAPVLANPPTAPPAATAVAPNTQLESQLNTLHEQVKQLQTENQTLQAKLKEALSVQPASVSPTELSQVQEQLRALMKENDLLKVSLNQQSGATGVVSTQAVAQLKLALADANQKLAAQTARADKLTVQNQALQTRLQSLMASADSAEVLRQENEVLKKEVARLKSAPRAGNAGESAELANARAQIVALQSAAATSSSEKVALENRVKRLEAVALNPSAAEVNLAQDEARIRELQKERDELQTQLGKANKKFQAQPPATAAQLDSLAQQVEALRSRIAVDEAQPIPYTPEELALFKEKATPLASNSSAMETSIHELPSGMASMAAEAQNYYSSKQYGKAEKDYEKILSRDKNNGVALANLAAIELEENKLDDADKHIQAALAQNPTDAYSLTVLGRLRFAEARFDDALNALSQAAKLDPQDPDIENYLGVTLAQKGLRAQAETALRRAVQLDPNYAAAHNNLAVIYLTQKPPMPELARWHYEKALANGQPRNPELEKLLSENGAPVNP